MQSLNHGVLSMFEIWQTNGSGTSCTIRFRRIEDALRYVADHQNEMSMAIRKPDGSWYNFKHGSAIHHRRPNRTARGTEPGGFASMGNDPEEGTIEDAANPGLPRYWRG